MRVINETLWNTADLKRLFQRVYEKNRKHEGKLRYKLKVRVAWGKRRSYGKIQIRGWAYLRSGLMTITLPRFQDGPLNVRELAWVFEHELLHCYGVPHRRMTGPQMTFSNGGEDFAYVDDLVIGQQSEPEPVEKPNRDVKAIRYARVLAALERNEAKQKRLQSAHKKLTVRRKYYERTLSRSKVDPT